MNEKCFKLQPGQSSNPMELGASKQHGLYFGMGLSMVGG